MRRMWTLCLAGVLLLTSCSMATVNPMTAPGGRSETDVAADETACAAAATPSAGHYALGALLTAGGIVSSLLTGVGFFHYPMRSDAIYVACLTTKGYVNPTGNPMPDDTPAPGQ